MESADVVVRGRPTTTLVLAHSNNGFAWMQDQLRAEPSQWLDFFAVRIDTGYLGDILNGARAAGLRVERE